MSNEAIPEVQATGYMYTHYDCPFCDSDIQFEGDTRGDHLECPLCGKEFEG